MIITPIRTYLLAQPAIAALLGSRMFPGTRHQDQPYPHATIRVAATSTGTHLKGVIGLSTSIVSIDCFAKEPGEAQSVAWAIFNSGLTRQKGVMSGVDIRGVQISSGPYDDEEAPTDGSDKPDYVSSIDFKVDYQTVCDP